MRLVHPGSSWWEASLLVKAQECFSRFYELDHAKSSENIETIPIPVWGQTEYMMLQGPNPSVDPIRQARSPAFGPRISSAMVLM